MAFQRQPLGLIIGGNMLAERHGGQAGIGFCRQLFGVGKGEQR